MNITRLIIILIAATTASHAADTLDVTSRQSSMVDDYLTRIAQSDWKVRANTIAQMRTPADVETRQRYMRAKLLESLGGFPADRTALNPQITGTLERNGYRVEKLIYESLPHYYVTANVYVPSSGNRPFPAVIGTAGHSDDGKAYPVYQRAFIELAKRGFVVLAYDPPDQGERNEYLDLGTGKSLVHNATAQHTMAGLQCLLTGGNIARYELWDGIRAMDYLLTRKDVDAKRIAVIGNSGGGTQSAYLAALEARFAAAAPSCYITSWKKLWLNPGPQDSEQVFTNFIKDGLDFSDFLVAFAPKPIEMLTAIKDFFPIDGARETYAEARHIFSILGKEDHVGYFEYDDTHGWSKSRREATYAWLEKWLQGRAYSKPESNFETEPPANLNCTRTGQVATAIKGETVQSLNCKLAEALYPRRRAATVKAPGDLRNLIRTRLAISPAEGKPNAELRGRIARDGYQIEKVSIESEAGIAIPMLVFVPQAPAARKTAIIAVAEAGKAAEAEAGGALEKLTRQGHVVISADLRGFGESQPFKQGKSGYQGRYQTDMRAILVGKTIAGMQAYDLLRVLSYAAARSDVDPSRITIWGKETAAVASLYAAALAPQVSKVVLENSILSYMDVVRAMVYNNDVADVVVPGVLRDFDFPDIVKAIGGNKVVLVHPVRPDGSPAPTEEAKREYGPDVRIASAGMMVQ